MKYTLLLCALGAYILYGVARKVLSFRKNYEAAKGCGLPIVLSPIWPISSLYLATEEKFLTPLLLKIPIVKHQRWVRVCPGGWLWEERRRIFEELGSDTFLIVTPYRNVVYTCSAGVIGQITTRRADFPKPTVFYRLLDIYGQNVVSAEGQEWRRHRKIVAPPFSERNNHLVWRESLYQAQNMLTQWTAQGGKSLGKISEDAMRLSLHIISRAGFNVRCLWPGVDDDDQDALKHGAMSTAVIPSGHEMSYVEAMSTLLHRIILVIAVPKWFTELTGFDMLKKSRLAYTEWGQYMTEMYQRKFAALSNFDGSLSGGDADPSLDLMGAMISSSGLLATGGKTPSKTGLSESEILGNSFVFMLAGHETAANTITHALYLLAMSPHVQRALQADLDSVFATRPDPSTWSYERDFTPLFGGIAGAVMNETLRLIPPVVIIPKSTYGMPPQTLTRDDGTTFTIPAEAYIGLCAAAAHRNPKTWPHRPARPTGPIHPRSNTTNDLEEFKPERWLLDPSAKPARRNTSPIKSPTVARTNSDDSAQADVVGVNTAPDTAPTLFRPPRGAYIPFSDGFRACVGRRFAQVEILAALAVIFRAHSVELAVDEWASDAEVEGMTAEERGETYAKARRAAEEAMNDAMATVITLQLRKRRIPVRFVERGKERFGCVRGE